MLADGPDDKDGPGPDPLMEVLTRRYYKVRALRDVRPMTVGGEQVLLADYRHRDRDVRVIVARATPDRLDAAIKAVDAAASEAVYHAPNGLLAGDMRGVRADRLRDRIRVGLEVALPRRRDRRHGLE